ncbi:hypothetical protein ACFVS2_20135 [Brevibacillus sp. NPDC058079]|uniref:CCA tRNA nucleotidyltransferase n=1 Tax=Brevibacillus sp. NPDC058079 TaxID=3346330 RepID=UPI0036EBD33D
MPTQSHRRIVELLVEHGFEALYVGGCVRGEFTGEEVNDYDIATNANPDQVAHIFRTWFVEEVGKNFGVMIVNGIEVATFRSESYLIPGKPDVLLVGNFEEDSARRDFTINALAKKLDGTIIDHHGGLQDIERKVIRAVNNPLERFIEDPSRILRGMYLAAKLSFSIEEETFRTMKKNINLLKETSVELVGKILMKVMKHNCLHPFMLFLKETGALKYVFPELCHTIGMPQNPKYHDSNVFDHIMRVLKSVEEKYPGDTILQLSAVFHDVAKGLPDVRGINKEGQPNDLEHEEAGVPITEQALLRLQFGKSVAKQVCFIVKFHGTRLDENPRRGSVTRHLRSMGNFFRDKPSLVVGITKLFQFMDCDSDGFEPTFGAEMKRITNSVEGHFRQVLLDTIFYRNELPINGRDLMNWGIYGEKIGEVLDYLVKENVQEVEIIKKRLAKRRLIVDAG